jgi:hypothetical protein
MRFATDQGALERAILHTILYADLFDYPLTSAEVAHYLIGLSCLAEEVCTCLSRSDWLAERVTEVDGYFVVRGREALVAQRLERAVASDRLWRRARRFVRVLRALPFVRMIGITGALAMRNSAAGDDIDVFIVTAPDRVWLTRAFAIGLVYMGKLCGDTLCPNYLISERVFALERHTLFVAHEFAQMSPVYGFAVYDQMLTANGWVHSFLPNASHPFWCEPEESQGMISRGIKRALEKCLSGRLGMILENWEMCRKIRKFQNRLGRPDGDAILDRDHVKGHFEDYGGPVMRLYTERLGQFDL